MGILPLTVIVVLLHVAAVVTGIFGENLTSVTGTAYYGGSSGPLPGEDSPYHAITSFLMGEDRPVTREPGDQGGFGLFKWIIAGPMCVFADVVKLLLNITTFNYAVIQLIPSEGFGLWVKVFIHSLSTAFNLYAGKQLIELLLRAGVFSNPYALVALGVLSSIGLVSIIANGTGALGC